MKFLSSDVIVAPQLTLDHFTVDDGDMEDHRAVAIGDIRIVLLEKCKTHFVILRKVYVFQRVKLWHKELAILSDLVSA